jgi:hypothetical protein
MLCYRDRTWCNNTSCDNSCGRQFTDEERRKAILWWGGEDFPISMADFHKNEVR